MSEEITNKLVPKLRFPEYRDRGDWEEKKLEEIANIIASGDLDSYSYSSVPTKEHTYPIYSNSISEGGLYGYNTYSKYKPNSITITARGTLGVAFVRNTEFVGIGRLLVISDLTNVNPIFFKENWNHYAIIPIENGGIPQLTAVKAKSVVLLYPKLQEQQKIADCLSSLDDLITAQKQKLEALKTHKKGLMQQLFPAEGKTVPKLRFEEFRESGDWVKNKLGQCLEQHPEYGINAAAVPYSSKLPTYLRITDISVDGSFIKDQLVSVAKDVTNVNYLKLGDIALARTGASVGKSYKYRIEDGELVFAGFLIRVSPNSDKLNSEFLFQYLFTDQYWKWINFTSTRSGQPGINGNEYASLPISLPPSLAEQQKIANCLSSLDKLISAQKEKIEALKVHKKGLMQALFPIFTA